MAREFVEYAGRKFWLQTSGRYFQSGVKTDRERLLHRRVWLDANGEIPEGFEVHHKDEDWRNNALDNLELRSGSEHRSHHAKARWGDPLMAEKMRAGLENAIKGAPKWHASDEGREWHRENGLKAWAKREIGSAVCRQCSKSFETPFPSRAELCSKRCENTAARAKYRERRNCAYCGAEFEVFKFTPTLCCSRSCASKRWRQA